MDEDSDAGIILESFFGPFSEPWADAVIAAQCVSAGEN
jgi:hypothetical protein